jgi:7-cyano-7-deazaguanine synthase
MSTVVLMSGGVDSSLAAVLAMEAGVDVLPLFVDYGQRAKAMELASCQQVCESFGLPRPVVVEMEGFGRVIPSGLTDPDARIREDAFLPGRNLLFLVAGAAFAYSRQAGSVVIGLLDESQRLFPDQSSDFLQDAERAIESALGAHVTIQAPLIAMSKAQVLALAAERGITGTYSCHAGSREPCGVCVSCEEIRVANAAASGEG